MVVQDIQKHNLIDEGYITRSSTPISRTHLEDDVLYTTLSPELHITEENRQLFYESEDEDILNVSFKTCPDMDEDALSVLYETCQGEQDIEDELESSEVMSELPLDGTIYEQVDERMKENISNVLEAIYQASNTNSRYTSNG